MNDHILYSANVHGAHHGHSLKIVDVVSEGRSEIYIETSEPGKCDCRSRIAISELTHLLANLTEQETLTIPNRDVDAAGHAHEASAAVEDLYVHAKTDKGDAK